MNYKMNFRKKVFKKEKIAKYAHNKLVNEKQEDVAVFELLEAYLTERIAVYKEGHRQQDLAGIQKKIDETNQFIKFLKK